MNAFNDPFDTTKQAMRYFERTKDRPTTNESPTSNNLVEEEFIRMATKYTIPVIAGPGESIAFDVPADTEAIVLTMSGAKNLVSLAAKIKQDLPIIQQVMADGKISGFGEYMQLLAVIADIAGVQ